MFWGEVLEKKQNGSISTDRSKGGMRPLQKERILLSLC